MQIKPSKHSKSLKQLEARRKAQAKKKKKSKRKKYKKQQNPLLSSVSRSYGPVFADVNPAWEDASAIENAGEEPHIGGFRGRKKYQPKESYATDKLRYTEADLVGIGDRVTLVWFQGAKEGKRKLVLLDPSDSFVPSYALHFIGKRCGACMGDIRLERIEKDAEGAL